MSFNPHAIGIIMARLAPQLPRGLTTAAYDPQDWAPLPAADCARLRAIPIMTPLALQLHQPRSRRSRPPAGGRAEGAGRRDSVLDRPLARGRGRSPAAWRRTSPSKAISRRSPLDHARRRPDLAGQPRNLPPLLLCRNILRGVRGAQSPPAAGDPCHRCPTSPSSTASPRSPPPNGMHWPPGTGDGPAGRPLHHPPLPVGAGNLRLGRQGDGLAAQAPDPAAGGQACRRPAAVCEDPFAGRIHLRPRLGRGL
jgi:hypothetical protein